MPAEHVPQIGVLHVMHIVASCTMAFSMCSREISVVERGVGLNISKWNFLHARVRYQSKNEFPSTKYFASRLMKQRFYFMPYYPYNRTSLAQI